MNKELYNGWTNYATWRVNLEIVEDMDFSGLAGDFNSIGELANHIKDYCIDVVTLDIDEGFTVDFAVAFMDDVNWHEIAKHVNEEYLFVEEGDDDDMGGVGVVIGDLVKV